MAVLVVTGRRLKPRSGFPSALSVLSTAAPGPFSKATPSMFLGLQLQAESEKAQYVLHTGDLPVPLFPSLYRRDLWQVRASELSTIKSG
ncbi:hypothetical protein DPMN_177761 [Dreissena polymorpha]|uniref:Uncharacterized protein n=1 Tax=Dreissena polymorpha TaxID=45954 RepID=A0A9D4EC75_DREPO|nr:hypothetical protein DPMN_177761 [Dreissena polymorpha]